jgi:1,2-diacylglycerol 3-alpha-glucosyltransferase
MSSQGDGKLTRMRILMVTDTYAPARNGVAVWVAMTVRELRARGHEVQVLTYQHDRRSPGEPGVIELPAWVGLDPDFKVAPILSGLPEEAEHGSWDIVHVHHPILLGPEGVRIGRRAGAKVFFTCHSVYTDYLDEYAWGLGRFLKGPLSRRVSRFVNRCDVALAPSTHVAAWMRQWGVSVAIDTFEAPADTQRVPPMERARAREALGLGLGAHVVLYVGRLAEEKRLEELMDEFAAGTAGIDGSLLVLAGGGRLEGALARRAERLGLADRVRVLTALNGDELGLWYSAADINVSASRSETGPLTVVEAMACGTPTVAFDGPGFEDRVVDGVNGILVEDRPGALGKAIGRVLADSGLRERLSLGATERAGLYSVGAVTDRLLGMYEAALR